VKLLFPDGTLKPEIRERLLDAEALMFSVALKGRIPVATYRKWSKETEKKPAEA